MGRCSPALDAFDDVALLPGEVVMVLHIEHHLSAKMLRDALMNARMIGCRVAAHQLHRRHMASPRGTPSRTKSFVFIDAEPQRGQAKFVRDSFAVNFDS